MRYMPLLTLGGMISTPAFAAATVNVTIPRLTVAEYHRPYMAVWLEPAGGGAIRTLSLWYDTKKGGNEPGTKWLSELRGWWRKGGKNLNLPADGISGATRNPGSYAISFPADLKPGAYVLNVEAARETGGRELVSLPISIAAKPARASGKTELGVITVSAR